MKAYLLGFLIVMGSSLFSQEFNRKVIDPENNKEILLGYATFGGLMTSDLFAAPFKKEYDEYKVESTIMKIKKRELRKTKITIVLATWCGDSKEQVPRFYKVLESIGYKTDRVTIICVDRKKMAGDIDVAGLNIQLVPTFIFSRKGKEIGRIIETPVLSLEKDMLKIINPE